MVDKIKAETWIGWIAACVATCVAGSTGLVVFAYANFETKEHNKEMHDSMTETMQRMENKIDSLADEPPTWPHVSRKPKR